jgi:phosphoglycerate dehydrogenase-like enzyme
MPGLPHVFVTHAVPEDGLQVLEGRATWSIAPPSGLGSDEEYRRLLGEAEGCLVVGSEMPGAVIRRAPRLRVISRFGVGYDGVDLQAATERGIIVCNAPQSPAEATADLTFALLMATARRLVDAHAYTGTSL